jgi:hypothetical protein
VERLLAGDVVVAEPVRLLADAERHRAGDRGADGRRGDRQRAVRAGGDVPVGEDRHRVDELQGGDVEASAVDGQLVVPVGEVELDRQLGDAAETGEQGEVGPRHGGPIGIPRRVAVRLEVEVHPGEPARGDRGAQPRKRRLRFVDPATVRAEGVDGDASVDGRGHDRARRSDGIVLVDGDEPAVDMARQRELRQARRIVGAPDPDRSPRAGARHGRDTVGSGTRPS